MRELIHVQVGQCGNQVGTKFWETVSSEERFIKDVNDSVGFPLPRVATSSTINVDSIFYECVPSMGSILKESMWERMTTRGGNC